MEKKLLLTDVLRGWFSWFASVPEQQDQKVVSNQGILFWAQTNGSHQQTILRRAFSLNRGIKKDGTVKMPR